MVQYLTKIVSPHRTSQAEMLLAKAYQHLGKRREAIFSFKNVLSKTNFAFEAMIGLVYLGEKTEDIVRLCVSGKQMSFVSLAVVPWIKRLLSAHEDMYNQSFFKASNAFGQLEEMYPNTLHLLEYKARCKVFADDLQDAKNNFESILVQDDGYSKSMDAYASALKKLDDISALKTLSHRLLKVAPHKEETWSAVSLIHNLKHPQQLKTTFSLIDKAICINPLYWFGYLQKGWLHLRQGNSKEAIQCFRDALRIDYNVFCFTGIVKAKLSCDEIQEAVCLANEGLKRFPGNPIAMTLLGTCFTRFPNLQEKAFETFSTSPQI